MLSAVGVKSVAFGFRMASCVSVWLEFLLWIVLIPFQNFLPSLRSKVPTYSHQRFCCNSLMSVLISLLRVFMLSIVCGVAWRLRSLLRCFILV